MSSGSLTSFKIDKRMSDTLQKLKEESGASSKAEVLRKAIALMTIIEEETHKGGRIQIVDVDENGTETNKRRLLVP